MAASRSIEAKLVISGEDRGASASIAKVVQAVKQMEDAAKVTKAMEQVARGLQEVEKQSRATDAVMRAHRGFAEAEAGLKATQGAATAAAKALNDAKVAKAAYAGSKAVAGTEEAKRVEAVTKAYRDAGAAYRKVEGDMRRANATVGAQAATMKMAEAEAVRFGVDLGGLAAHQRRLQSATESATNAVRTQIRVEDQAARAASHHAREQAEAARHRRQHGAIGLATTAAAGYVSAHSVVHGATDAVKAGARLQHETVALKNAGRTPEELVQIERASRATVKAVPTATFEENLKVVNETVSAFGSLDHALEHLTFMQKASAAVHAAAGSKITDSAGEMGNKMARFAEERGSAGDGHRFEKETEGLVRAMVFSGGNFNPHEAINFAQQAKSSLRGYDEEFLTTIMPSIVGTMKGERAGTAANAFNNVINGKVNDKKQAEEWMKYGLLDTKQAIMKGGHAVAWRTGAVKDTTLAHQNPLKWMETVVLPALKAKGVKIDDDEELSKVFATMFRGNTSNFFANEIGLKSFRSRLHKDADLQKNVGSLDDIYARNLKEDPTEGVKAFKSGLEDIMAAATSPMMGPAAIALKGLAEGLQSVALVAKDHPLAAAATGGAAVAGGVAASGFASYKLMTGFGLPSAAAELTVAAKMLQGTAVQKGAVPDAVKAVPLAALGLTGVTLGTAAGAAFAGYATAQEIPKIAEKEGRGAIDPATGEHLDLSVPNTTPWLRDWWTKNAPVMLGGAPEETGKQAGEAIGKGLVTVPLPPRRPAMLDDFKTKVDETGGEAGKSLMQRLMETVANGIDIKVRFTPDGGVGAGGGSGVQTASFGGAGGGGLGNLIHKASLSGSGGFTGGFGGAVVRGGGGGDGLKGGSTFEGGRTANQMEAYKAARAMGLSDLAARVLVANVSGESLDNPADHHQDGPHTAEGIWQHDPWRAGQIAKHFGKRLRDMNVTEQMQAGLWEMKNNPAYRRSWEALQGTDAGAMMRTIIGNHERPADEVAAFNHRMRILRRFDPNAAVGGDFGGLGAGLRVKGGMGGQATAGGGHASGLTALAEQLQKAGGFNRVTGFNDRHHAGSGSMHARGLAMDLTGDPARIMSNTRAIMEARGLVEGRDYRMINEYAQRSKRWTGGHVHFEFRNRGAAGALGGGLPGPKEGGLAIPEAPAGGLGVGGGRRGDISSHIEEFGRHVDRLQDMGFHGQIELVGSGGVRPRGMRVKTRGPMTADVGVSMPGAKEADDDWL